MKLISWNVNGFRACLQKGFEDFFNDINADIFCIQETKMQPDQANFSPEGYNVYFNSAIKKGYSGTAIFTKLTPLSVKYGINDTHNDEGRVITLEFDKFFMVNCYVPNAQRELARIDYRMQFEDAMRDYLTTLSKDKPVIYCGDLNVAHNEIDLKNPKSNIGNAGFSYEERGKFTELLEAGFTDTFRYLYPDKTDAYSWWSYMFNARAKNVGWRIDYFVVSKSIENNIVEAEIYPEIMGSDHCPVGLTIEI
ncbi:MAG: exodeoxyribonuclease III [Clostridia bacterium]|nr:exodeoxyribonuclease III [Clostridia bacterium]